MGRPTRKPKVENQDKALETKLQPLAGARKSAESDVAVQACNDWLRMGSGRSISKLLQHYQEQSKFIKGFTPPSLSVDTLYTWSTHYGWAERKQIYDADIEMRKNRDLRQVMELDLANPHGRIGELIQLAQFLKGQIYEQAADGTYHNIWVPDVKSVGSGDKVEIIDIERFNAPLVKEFRETLNDIAAETGGRVRHAKITHEFTWVHQAIDDLREGRLTPELLLEEFGSLEDARLAALEDTGGNSQLVEQFMMLAASTPLAVEVLDEED